MCVNRFLFTGREYLKEVNLYDYRNRIYSPELGRFLQTDPIGFWNNEGTQGIGCWKQAKSNPKFADVDDVNFHQEENGWQQMKSNPKFTRLEDINLYRYVKNNSINLIDPQGTSSFGGKLCRTACVAIGAAAAVGCTGDAWEIALCVGVVAGLTQLCTESCPY